MALLIVEDGSGVEGANSYVTLQEIRNFVSQRGYSLPVEDVKVAVLAVKAKDYLEAKRNQFKGRKLYGLGYLQWPRRGVLIDRFEVPEDTIPDELKNAQCQLCVDLQTTDVAAQAPNTTGLVVKREKVDVLETEYFNPNEVSAQSTTATMPKVDAFLEPLLKEMSGLRVERA